MQLCFRTLRANAIASAAGLLIVQTSAQVVFTDNFAAEASSLWGNERGDWSAAAGVYDARLPSNRPPTYSSLPFILGDFSLEVDINQVADGGIWLRCDAQGSSGVLLVTGGRGWGVGIGDPEAGRSLYWHVAIDGQYSDALNEAHHVFTDPGVENAHLRVEVSGDVYAAFLNGSTDAITTLTNSTFRSGRVGLYDFSVQTFDNVVLEGEPLYRLNIAERGPSEITLSWSSNSASYVLESALFLPTASWDSVTNAPVIVGDQFTVPVSATNRQEFFRLRKP
jgi:hypothetical protein